MKKFSTSLIILMFVTQTFYGSTFLTPHKAEAISGSWTQTTWTGGEGQIDWSDTTKFNSATGEDLYLGADLKMKINADVVVGQADMISGTFNQGGTVASNTLYSQYGMAVCNNKFIVSDFVNYRVLIYNTVPTVSNASADVVIGQPNMTSGLANQGGAVGANTFNGPVGIFCVGPKLIISDNGNHRVLIFNTIPTTNNASADVVIGQANMTTGSPNQGGAVGANTLKNPFGLFSDGTKLFVADDWNHRVLIYNTIPTVDNASADVVIGQPNMTSNSINQGGSPAANTLHDVNGVYSDGTKLILTSNSGHRVLIYNTIPTTNNASADVVIGQPDMTTNSANQGGSVGANTLRFPHPVMMLGSRLLIPDHSNNRVLVYNSIPTVNNASADQVIGQPNFTSGDINQGGSVGAETFKYANYLLVDNSRLFASDNGNNRILIYNLTPTTTKVTSSVYNAGEAVKWGPITWTATTSAYSSVTMEVSTDLGSTWSPVSNGQENIGQSQRIQYRATLSSTNGIDSPTLSDVTINYGDIPSTTTSGSRPSSTVVSYNIQTPITPNPVVIIDTTPAPVLPPVITPTTNPSVCTFSDTLKITYRGPGVACLQTLLNITPKDGIFGPQTKAAVILFQTSKGLTPDGIAGPLTRGALGR